MLRERDIERMKERERERHRKNERERESVSMCEKQSCLRLASRCCNPTCQFALKRKSNVKPSSPFMFSSGKHVCVFVCLCMYVCVRVRERKYQMRCEVDISDVIKWAETWSCHARWEKNVSAATTSVKKWTLNENIAKVGKINFTEEAARPNFMFSEIARCLFPSISKPWPWWWLSQVTLTHHSITVIEVLVYTLREHVNCMAR